MSHASVDVTCMYSEHADWYCCVLQYCTAHKIWTLCQVRMYCKSYGTTVAWHKTELRRGLKRRRNVTCDGS